MTEGSVKDRTLYGAQTRCLCEVPGSMQIMGTSGPVAVIHESLISSKRVMMKRASFRNNLGTRGEARDRSNLGILRREPQRFGTVML